MKNLIVFAALVTLSITTFLNAETDNTNQPGRIGSEGLQIPFIKNEGQLEADAVKFYTKTFNGTVFVTENGELVYDLIYQKDYLGPDDIFLPNGSTSGLAAYGIKEIPVTQNKIQIQALEPAQTRVNYIIDEPENWRDNIPTFHLVTFGELWKGITFNLKANQKNIEKVFIVQPGGDVNSIWFRLEGIDALSLSESGELRVNKLRNISFTRPVAYQEIERIKKPIEVSYRIIDKTSYGFTVGGYDHSIPLVIDPLLSSTYIGGSGEDVSNGIAIDNSGNIFIAGYTLSSNYPTVVGSYDTGYSGNYDIVVSKFNPAITAITASTFIGGSTRSEFGLAIALDASGNVFVAGYCGTSTSSPTIPATTGAYDTTFNGSWDACVAKLNNNLTATNFVFTFLGGTSSDFSYGITTDRFNNVFVCGETAGTGFPAVGGPYTTFGGGFTNDGFVAKFNNNLTATGFISTFLGGSAYDALTSITVDSSDYVITVGVSYSPNFPTTAGAYDPAPPVGSADATVTKFYNSLTSTSYSTMLGGTGYDVAYAVTTDRSNNIFVAGDTASSNFPISSTDSTYFAGGIGDAFVTKFNPLLSNYIASRYLGGSGWDVAHSIATGPFAGEVFVGGYTASSNFPAYPSSPPPYDSTLGGGSDAFIARLNNNLGLICSTYVGGSSSELLTTVTNRGGIAVDGTNGTVLLTGATYSADFPTFNPIAGTFAGAPTDIFLMRITANLRGGTVTTTTALAPPNLLFPLDNSSNEPTSTILQWETPSNAIIPVTYALYFSTVSYPLAQIYAGTSTSTQPPILQNETTYYWYVVATDGEGRISWSNIRRFTTETNPLFVSGSSGGIALGADAFTKPIGKCFVATTVYGSPDHPNVVALRKFRDKHLLTNPIGTFLVNQYYQKGPALSDYVKNSGFSIATIRIGLIPLILALKYPIYVGCIIILLAIILVRLTPASSKGGQVR